MNAMQAASAALAVGLPERAVVKGLRTFVLDPERNPGRANLFALDGRVDRPRLRPQRGRDARPHGDVQRPATPGREIWLTICTAGDRTDEILHGFAYVAARGADHVAVAELLRYLRGRDRVDVIERLVAGARDGGAAEVDVYADELAALRSVLGRSKRGDVIGVTALGMRNEVFGWLEEAGASRLTPARVRQLVKRAAS